MSRYGPYTAVYPTRTAVYGRVDGFFRSCRWPVHRVARPSTRRHVYAAVYVSCTRPCARPVHGRITAMPYTRPVHGRAVYTARAPPCMGRAHGPSTPPVYMTVYGPSARTSSAVYMERTRTWNVHGPYTGLVHGRVRAVHTAVYTTRIRPRTRVYVSMCKRAVYTALLHIDT